MLKKFLPLVILIAFAALFVSCGSEETPPAQTPPPSGTETLTADPAPPEPAPITTGTDTVEFAVREGAIDFADSNTSFILVDASPADASKGVELSVADVNGKKMLKIENTASGKPYVAVDASSLLGERIADMRSMEFTVYTEHPDGKFYPASGYVIGYVGTNRDKVQQDWSVFMETKNPNVGKYVPKNETQYMIADNYNFFVLTVEEDLGEGVVMYISDICFLDADGNVLPVDTSVKFNAPAGFGQMDISNLIGVSGEKNLNLTGSSAGGWGQAVAVDTVKNTGGVIDPAWFTPGCVVTVFYSSANPPELIIQSWTDGNTNGWAKVAPFTVNDSGTVAQFSYDDMVASFGTDDFETFFDKFNVGDTGEAMDVSMVTIGTGKPDSPYVQEDRSNLFDVVDEIDLGLVGSSAGGWGQAVSIETVKNDGLVDAALFTPGCVVTVYYVSALEPELVIQSWTDGNTNGWAKVAPAAKNDSGSTAQFIYDDMVASFGTDDFETFFDKFNVGDTGEALDVVKVTIGKLAE